MGQRAAPQLREAAFGGHVSGGSQQQWTWGEPCTPPRKGGRRSTTSRKAQGPSKPCRQAARVGNVAAGWSSPASHRVVGRVKQDAYEMAL